MCARYQARPTEKHLHAVKRIFRYLKGTVNRGLWYPKDSSIALTAFAEDAEQCGCQTSAETSGCMQVLGRYRTLLAGHKKGEKRCDIQFWKLNIMLSLEEKELDISYQQAKNAEFYAGDSPNNWQMKLMNSGGTYSNILCRNQQGERSRCILDSVLGLLLNGFASLSFEVSSFDFDLYLNLSGCTSFQFTWSEESSRHFSRMHHLESPGEVLEDYTY
ncbi:hypothetical protein Tco_0707419 [Tanacetum coccineum]|uniref:Uncharacterized protein n=1 Tax=Tanacetum coccineum TaxID=301880 RepID=A0ABQ4YA83_9ASTR